MTADGFDPYHKWLGIPAEEQPPTHYRLLGLVQFEADHDVIANAASRQAFHLRQLQTGPQAAAAQRLLKEVATAKATLLDPETRAEYDQSLAAPDVGLPIDEIAAIPTFRKKRAKAKAFDFTPLLVRGVPLALIAVVLLVVLRISDKKDVPKPAAVSTGAAELQSSDVVDSGLPPGSAVVPPAGSIAAANDREKHNKPAERPGADSLADHSPTEEPAAVDDPDSAAMDPDAMESAAMESAAAEKPAAKSAPGDDSQPAAKAAARADDMAAADMESEPAFEADPTKEPLPSDDDLGRASKLVRSKHKAEFAKAKTAEQKEALAKNLLAEAHETEDLTDRYATIVAAIDLASAAGDFQLAVDGWNDLGEHFQVDALAGQWKVLEKSLKSKQVDSLKVCLDQFAESALEFERYELARGALKALLAVSKPADAMRYQADLKNLDALVARSAEAKSALEKLKTDPSDPQANQTAGEFLSFFKLDWPQGLLLLSRSGDAKLKGLASDELAQPNEAKGQLRLADAWWSFGEEQADEKIKAGAKIRARFWYMEALPDLQGDARAKAERRATLEARVHRQSAAEAKITPQVLKSKFEGKAVYDPQSNWLTVSYDFHNQDQLKDFAGDARFSAGEIEVPAKETLRHLVKFKTLKMTGTVTMKSKTGDVIGGSAGMQAHRDGTTVKINSGADAASSSDHGPTDDDLVLPLEMDAGEKLVVFRLGDEVVGKPMAKCEPGQLLLCGGEAGAQFSQLAISGQPDPEWLVDFFGLPKPSKDKNSPAGKSTAKSAAAKTKSPMKFERVAKVVLWNEHNAAHNNSGTRVCNLVLSRGGKTVWQKKDLEIPWERNEPTKLAVDVPQITADSVRVEITAWHGESGGLAEVEVLDKADKNLAPGALVIVSTEHRSGDPRNAATLIDGITDSAAESVGYWLPRNGEPGWVDLRLLPQEVTPPASGTPVAATKQAAATKEPPVKVKKKGSGKPVDAKIFASCDDEFQIYVNGQFVLEGKENESFSKDGALAAGDVITVKAKNYSGKFGFCCVIKFANGQVFSTSDGWGAYIPTDSGPWFLPAQIANSGPAVRGDADWPQTNVKKASGVNAEVIWGPDMQQYCYLFLVVGPLDAPKKDAAQ